MEGDPTPAPTFTPTLQVPDVQRSNRARRWLCPDDVQAVQACLLLALPHLSRCKQQEQGTKSRHRVFPPQDDFLLRHYDSGDCQGKLGHSRASVIWHRAQVADCLEVSLEITIYSMQCKLLVFTYI